MARYKTTVTLGAGDETVRNGPIISDLPEIARVSRPAGDLVGLGRWAPRARAEHPRKLAYLVDTPEGR